MKVVLVVAAMMTAHLGASEVASAKVYAGETISSSPLDRVDVYRAGFMEPSFRDSVLAKAWSYDVGQTERAGCIGSWRAFPTGSTPDGKSLDSSYYVYKVDFKESEKANTRSIAINCGKGVPFFHTHPYQSCDDSGSAANCKTGGWYASFCEPSRADLRLLIELRAPFGVIQCDMHAFRFFFLADAMRT